MSINTSSNDILYLTYRNVGPNAALIVPAVLLNFVTIPGIFLNSIVVIVTFMSKSLHGSANFLMALICFFEALHQSGHCIFLGITLSGTNFVSLSDAFRLLIYMIFALNASLFGMASAAFDRLFAVIAQHRHKRLNKPIYLAIHASLCACYGIYSVFYVYEFVKENPGNPTTGCIADIYNGVIGTKFFLNTIILNGISAAFYIAVGVIIRLKKGVTKETNARLLKSLVIILVITIGGYCINLGIYQILFAYMAKTPIFLWHLGFIMGILLNLGAAMNGPILYLNSSEYRKAFKRNFYKMLILFGKNPSQIAVASGELFQIRTTQVNNNSLHQQQCPSALPSQNNAARGLPFGIFSKSPEGSGNLHRNSRGTNKQNNFM